MKATHRRLLAVLLALLVCCGLATMALAADGRGPKTATAESTAEDSADKGYTLTEDIEIEDGETPLAAGVIETRCVLHVILFLMALAVAVCFLYTYQKHQARQQELLARLGRQG